MALSVTQRRFLGTGSNVQRCLNSNQAETILRFHHQHDVYIQVRPSFGLLAAIVVVVSLGIFPHMALRGHSGVLEGTNVDKESRQASSGLGGELLCSVLRHPLAPPPRATFWPWRLWVRQFVVIVPSGDIHSQGHVSGFASPPPCSANQSTTPRSLHSNSLATLPAGLFDSLGQLSRL